MSADERWVVLGLAQVRSPWFGDVARWSNAAILPIEFVKCLSGDEVRARLRSGRAFSALVIDSSLPTLDRDLIDEATSTGCAVIVIDGGRTRRDWTGLGASVVLPPDFDPGTLVDVLSVHAPMIDQIDRSLTSAPGPAPTNLWRGQLVGVMGGGGTGTSTMAMALAEAFARDPRYRGLALLADLRLDADLALLHHVGDVVPGVQELVEATRLGSPTPDEVRSFTVQPHCSTYPLLMGLRRHRDWVTLRPRALHSALDGIRRAYTITVADIDADLEGERHTGSLEVEERNLLARTIATDADLLVITGLPTLVGLQRFVRVIHAVVEHGVHPARVLPMMNRAPKSPSARSELTAAVARLTASATGGTDHCVQPVVFVGERRKLDLALRDAAGLPRSLVESVGSPTQAVLDRVTDVAMESFDAGQPQLIAPGTIGSWATDDGEVG